MVLFQSEMWRSRGPSYLTSTNHLIALATILRFVSHFGQHFFYSPFIFLGLLSWYLAFPIQILKLSEWCLYVWFIFPLLPSPEGELYVGCSTLFARASFGQFFFFNHVAASLLEKAWCKEAPSLWTEVY